MSPLISGYGSSNWFLRMVALVKNPWVLMFWYTAGFEFLRPEKFESEKGFATLAFMSLASVLLRTKPVAQYRWAAHSDWS